MKTIYLFILMMFLALPLNAEEAPQMSERLIQEEFAVELVKMMHLDHLLPTAALASDCVSLLERIGISPMQGWKNKALLTQEEYLVVLAKTYGREGILHKRAVAVEEKNIEVINTHWQSSYDKNGRWVLLAELLSDKEYFPQGPPKSPYGHGYKDDNNDHKVDRKFLPTVGLMKLRDFISE